MDAMIRLLIETELFLLHETRQSNRSPGQEHRALDLISQWEKARFEESLAEAEKDTEPNHEHARMEGEGGPPSH